MHEYTHMYLGRFVPLLKLRGLPDFPVNLVVEIAQCDERQDPDNCALVVAVEDDIRGILVQLSRPIVQSSILVEMLELQKFGKVDEKGEKHDKNEIPAGIRLVFQRVADGVISEN